MCFKSSNIKQDLDFSLESFWWELFKQRKVNVMEEYKEHCGS